MQQGTNMFAYLTQSTKKDFSHVRSILHAKLSSENLTVDGYSSIYLPYMQSISSL